MLFQHKEADAYMYSHKSGAQGQKQLRFSHFIFTQSLTEDTET